MSHQDIGYVWEQLYGAVSSMIASDSSLHDRLLDAVVSRVNRVFGFQDAVPEEIGERLETLQVRLTKLGSFEDTIKAMESREVTETIEEIFLIFNNVAREYPNN